jgi:uncharacterized membrane protein
MTYRFDRPFGRILFAIAMMGLGVLTFIYGDFALTWQPIPPSVPGRDALVYVSAVCLLAGGLGILLRPVAAPSAVFLTIYLLFFWVLPHVAKLMPALASVGQWLGFCETLGVMSGACLLWAPSEGALARLARGVFGVCCIVYGVSHFVYADFTAGMIPRWLPHRLWLAYATGICHVLAGVGIAIGVFPRLAATLEALMMSGFVLLLHVPSLWTIPAPEWGPTLRTQLTPLFWASALAASAWLVGRSFSTHPWGLRRC